MNNKPLFIILGVFLLLLTIGMGMSYFYLAPEAAELLIRIGSYGGLLLGTYVLISNGTTFKTWTFWPLLFCVAVFGIGALMKIMHWPFANKLLLVGGGSFFAFYLVAFILKPLKGRLDILKLLWVLVATVGSLGVIFHLLPREIIYLRTSLFWIMILDFILLEQKRKTVPNVKD